MAGVTRRCAGGRWRLLVHDRLERKSPEGYLYGGAHSVGSSPELAGEDREGHHVTILPDTEFDELVVGRGAIHVEQMSAGAYWLNVGGLVVNVQIDRDGKPLAVTAELEPVEGVVYELDL